MAAILPAFRKFKVEGAIIGRLLAGYSDIEIGLMNCVQVVRDDLDTALKIMFRVRGETSRVDVADAFGRQYYADLELETQFSMAIGSVRHCLKIRNQYAHCFWWDPNAGKLAFGNMEEIAFQPVRITNLRGLTPLFVDPPLLEAQENYFDYTDSLLQWVNFEGRTRAGKPSMPQYEAPRQLLQPPLHIRPGDAGYPPL